MSLVPPTSQQQAGPSGTSGPPQTRQQSTPPPQQRLDLHVCVDKRWRDPPPTFPNELEAISKYSTDEELYRDLRKLLRSSKGWMGWLSWKSCREVDFAKFIIAKSNTDKVSPTTTTSLPNPMTGYQHKMPAQAQAEQMRMVAQEIVAGIANPANEKGIKEIVDLLPKKEIPEKLVRKINEVGWGIRPPYGFAV